MLNGRQIRVSLRTKDEAVAQAKFLALTAARTHARSDVPYYFPVRTDVPWEAVVTEGARHSGGWLSVMYQRTKDRATSRGVQFSLTKSDLKDIALRSAGRCELTAHPFSWDRVGQGMFSPYAPSIDKITPADGYRRSNCRLVCYAANVAIADWGHEVFDALAMSRFAALGYTMTPPAQNPAAP